MKRVNTNKDGDACGEMRRNACRKRKVRKVHPHLKEKRSPVARQKNVPPQFEGVCVCGHDLNRITVLDYRLLGFNINASPSINT